PGARVAYEAGPTGFGLYRYLVAAGVDCEAVAPGLVPVRPGDRVKTDKRDAKRLAVLHAGGLLTAIFVPSPELEALRDLVRAREDARLDRMRARDRHADRRRPGVRGRRLRPLQDRRAVHELRRPGPFRALKRGGSPARIDHQGRLSARPPTTRRSRLELATSPDRRLRARPPST